LRKTALITGVTGQDGSYLAQFLLGKKYRVIGTVRKKLNSKTWRLKKLKIDNKIILEKMDLEKIEDINMIFYKYKINEVYNLASQSFVNTSFSTPIKTTNITALGVIRILETIKNINPKIKFYQASSSEMYGNTLSNKQSEKTKFNPQSPYAISKLFGHYITKNYRNSYNLYAVSGILFNHESPLRSNEFVTKKIISGLINIINKKKKFIELGNVYSKRDWGYAKEYVVQMWKMLQLKKADDFVIATGKTHSIKELIDIATKYLNLNVKWVGSGLKLRLINNGNNQTIIKINKKFFRPADVNRTKGNIEKAVKILKWKPKITFKKLVRLIIEEELKDFSNSK
jgi:GDPmannose 4,6-dehydratase|tara:strand:- start:92 stop:1117 length:1026 start_codon:yes stop_codon:yes gene_type:complete